MSSTKLVLVQELFTSSQQEIVQLLNTDTSNDAVVAECLEKLYQAEDKRIIGGIAA